MRLGIQPMISTDRISLQLVPKLQFGNANPRSSASRPHKPPAPTSLPPPASSLTKSLASPCRAHQSIACPDHQTEKLSVCGLSPSGKAWWHADHGSGTCLGWHGSPIHPSRHGRLPLVCLHRPARSRNRKDCGPGHLLLGQTACDQIHQTTRRGSNRAIRVA